MSPARKVMVSKRSMIARLKQEQKVIAAARDRLRTAIEEYEGMIDSADRGVNALQEAIDALSELV